MGKHRILVIGVGSIGERHLRTFGQTGRADLSICEVNGALRQAVGDRYGVRKRYASLDEATGDGSQTFDAAIICAPAQFHVPMAAQLAKAGVNLLIEKPLSTNENGISELAELIRQRKLKAMVAYTYRSHPALRSMKKAIEDGRFGKPVEVVSVWGQHFPKYRPAYRNTYYVSHASGGGAIQDSITHALNAGEFLLGPIDRVMADAAHLILPGVEVEDTVHVIVRHGPVLGCYTLNQHQAPNEHTLTVMCERGTARFELQNARWMSMVEPGTEWREELQFSLERDDIFVNQANIFIDVLEGKMEPPCTLEQGLQTMRVNLAILAASQKPSWRAVGG
jgi:predicted dehydrogenase